MGGRGRRDRRSAMWRIALGGGGWVVVAAVLVVASSCVHPACESACETAFEDCRTMGKPCSMRMLLPEDCGDYCDDTPDDCERCFDCVAAQGTCSMECGTNDSCKICFPPIEGEFFQNIQGPGCPEG